MRFPSEPNRFTGGNAYGVSFILFLKFKSALGIIFELFKRHFTTHTDIHTQNT